MLRCASCRGAKQKVKCSIERRRSNDLADHSSVYQPTVYGPRNVIGVWKKVFVAQSPKEHPGDNRKKHRLCSICQGNHPSPNMPFSNGS